MDIDKVIDVPDTPDRIASKNINCGTRNGNVSNTSFSRDYGKLSLNLRGKSRLIPDDGLHKPFNKLEVTKCQNKAMVHSPENSSVPKNNSHIYRRPIEGTSRNSSRVQVTDKGKGLCDESLIKASNFQEDNGNNLSGGEKLNEGSRARNSSKTSGTHYKGKEKASGDIMDHWKGFDLARRFPSLETGKIASTPAHSIAIGPPRVTGRKRLVRNGVISPLNVAKFTQSAQQKQIISDLNNGEGTTTGGLASRNPQYLIDISDSSAEGTNHSRAKGKGVSNFCTASELDAKTRHLPDSSVSHNEEANGFNKVNGNASGCLEEHSGWRTTSNRSRKMHLSPSDKGNIVNPDIIRRSKHGSTSSNRGENSSVSGFDDSEVMFLGSSMNSPLDLSSLSSIRNGSNGHRGTMDPVLEVDEVSPEIRSCDSLHVAHGNGGVSLDARARQLEADERLAFEIQQQLYKEPPIIAGFEIDANMAWRLQQEEDSERATFNRSHGVMQSSGSSNSATLRQPRPRRPQNHSLRRSLTGRVSNSSRMAQLRAQTRRQAPSNLRRGIDLFPRDMDMDTRIDVLEALEAVWGEDLDDEMMDNHIFQTQRDFNENDYEMLLALDENNDQHAGAPVGQISRLPESIVQTDKLEEVCAICLETPTAGETIRHLPCFHKFHKHCIDPWLTRRTSCPVCKSSIT